MMARSAADFLRELSARPFVAQFVLAIAVGDNEEPTTQITSYLIPADTEAEARAAAQDMIESRVAQVENLGCKATRLCHYVFNDRSARNNKVFEMQKKLRFFSSMILVAIISLSWNSDLASGDADTRATFWHLTCSSDNCFLVDGEWKQGTPEMQRFVERSLASCKPPETWAWFVIQSNPVTDLSNWNAAKMVDKPSRTFAAEFDSGVLEMMFQYPLSDMAYKRGKIVLELDSDFACGDTQTVQLVMPKSFSKKLFKSLSPPCFSSTTSPGGRISVFAAFDAGEGIWCWESRRELPDGLGSSKRMRMQGGKIVVPGEKQPIHRFGKQLIWVEKLERGPVVVFGVDSEIPYISIIKMAATNVDDGLNWTCWDSRGDFAR